MRYVVIVFLVALYGIFACGSADESSEQQRQIRQERDTAESVEQLDSPSISVEYITGKFDPSKDNRFVLIDQRHADESGMYLRREAYEAFIEMHNAAERDGIDLTILSAARNFDVQRSIWEAKWNGNRLVEGGVNLAKEVPDPKERALRILRYSAMPGTSRHHWGTEIDLNALNNDYFKRGEGARIYRWLRENADKYGYCQPYTSKNINDRTGYEEERWHWSYMPLAKPFLKRAKTVLQDEHISGFDGSNTAPQIGVVERYVFGVAPTCQGD